jgi:hypothetical protein
MQNAINYISAKTCYIASSTAKCFLLSEGFFLDDLANGQVVRHLLCPNQHFNVAHSVWHSTGSLVSSYISCPNILQDKKFNVSCVFVYPHVVQLSDGTGTGIDLEILESVGKQIGFFVDQYHFKENVIAALSEMKTNKLPIVPLTFLNHAFYNMVDFSAFTYPMGLHLVSAKPQKIAPYFNLLKPFQPLLWVVILSTGLVTFIIGVVLAFLDSSHLPFPMIESMWSLFAILCGQGAFTDIASKHCSNFVCNKFSYRSQR